MRATRPALLTAAGLGVGITAAIVLVPQLRFAYRSPELHLALVTAEALIAMLVAYLVVGRFRRRRRVDDLVLSLGLGTLSVTNLAYGAVPAVFASDDSVFSTWSAQTGRVAGAVLVAAAALAPMRPTRLSREQIWMLSGGVFAGLAAVGLVVAGFEHRLPSGVDPAATPDASRSPRLEGHVGILAAQIIGAVLYTVAAIGFGRRSARGPDPLLSALALAAVFAAVARVNYMMFPSVATPYVYVGDGFRLLFYLVILAGAIAEIGSYWRSVAEVATLRERGRIARDLHDGVAQDLASIQRNLHYLDPDDRFVRRAREAADRALRGARQAISALSEAAEQPIDAALAEVAREVGEREGTQVVLDLAEGVQVSAPEREALVRIAAEAITNAARHGGAHVVRVQLTAGREVRLRVLDHGCGFDVTAPADRTDGGGFGLRGMRSRAESVGARLTVTSAPGAGTSVEVRI